VLPRDPSPSLSTAPQVHSRGAFGGAKPSLSLFLNSRIKMEDLGELILWRNMCCTEVLTQQTIGVREFENRAKIKALNRAFSSRQSDPVVAKS